MLSIRGKKRKSVESNEGEDTQDITMGQKVPTKSGSPSTDQENPHKKRKTGITITQKQALIDNLQLEITERARKLRANYNIHAQSLRTRIEIRVNRIPLSLRRAKMGDLLQKYSAEGQQKASANPMRGPPVPEKDIHTAMSRYPLQRTAHMLAMGSPAHMIKRGSRDISGGDKENEISHIESPKKARLGPAAEIARNHPAQVLSPASSNSRIAPRGAAAASSITTNLSHLSPVKSGIARPVSPVKSSNLISNMVEKARATTTRGTAPATKRGRANTTSTIPSSSSSERSGGPSRATRTRGTAAYQQPARPATRTAPRVSGISESSDGSTSTVVRKRPGTAMSTKSAPGGTSSAPAKRNVISTIKKGVAASTSRKATASTKAAATPASATSTGRVLRKRG